MACKLAREVFFGDSLLAECTTTGKRVGLVQLDPTKLDHLFSVLNSKMHHNLTATAFNEKYKRECLTSIAQLDL